MAWSPLPLRVGTSSLLGKIHNIKAVERSVGLQSKNVFFFYGMLQETGHREHLHM